MAARWTSQALAEGMRLGSGSRASAGAVPEADPAPESVVTSLAGFAESGSALTTLDGFADVGSVVTSLAGFDGAARPHPPGGRRATPAAFK